MGSCVPICWGVCLAREAVLVAVRVNRVSIGRTTVNTGFMCHKFACHCNQSMGIACAAAHFISCFSHHWAYVVLDFLLILLNGAWKIIRISRCGLSRMTALILRLSSSLDLKVFFFFNAIFVRWLRCCSFCYEAVSLTK